MAISSPLVKIVFAPDSTSSQRFFAACEFLCKPLSLLALLMIPGWAALRRMGVEAPQWIVTWAHPILVSAAIGYLTNWIAIEMLFKPYEQTWRHLFPWLSLGLWRQGLIPKNKEKIAATMGEKVAGELLQPEKLAKDLCDMVGGLLENREMVAQLQGMLKQQVLGHRQQIVDYLGPKITAGVLAELDRVLTAENVRNFWDAKLEPRLESQEVRQRIAALIIHAIQERSPAIAEAIRPALIQLIADYFRDMAGPLAGMLGGLAEGLADRMLSSQTIEKGILSWVNNPDTPATLCDGVSGMVTTIRNYVKSPKTDSDLGNFVQEMRDAFRSYMDEWMKATLPAAADAILGAESLWNWGTAMVVGCRPQLEKFMTEKGMPMIMEKLNIQGRIQQAVDQQDMRQFHQMISDVTAQHLGAIQVLGFLLGAAAGALMILCA